MTLHNYPKEFVERTLKLVDSCFEDAKAKELEVTFLLNCLLGLIVAVYEKLEKCKGDFFSKKLHDKEVIDFIPDKIAQVNLNEFFKSYKDHINKKSLIGQSDSSFVIESKIIVAQRKEANNLTLKQFIRNIRNGIAHQNLMATNTSEHWEGIRIWNHTKDGIKDFEVEFRIGQLKRFAIFIGQKFIETATDEP